MRLGDSDGETTDLFRFFDNAIKVEWQPDLHSISKQHSRNGLKWLNDCIKHKDRCQSIWICLNEKTTMILLHKSLKIKDLPKGGPNCKISFDHSESEFLAVRGVFFELDV